ncbi:MULTISPECIES: hypothetical protein [Stenotrophomonas]|uniref:Uncharacterized protein n=1 Tax=Stenotrophomonas lactitubi TaxID=2045214 RepID=A0AAW4GIL4_9GAMM|nr:MULTISPECIES: hypothetical protein [Stenotrophomonas]MBM9913995.1 hypothetical protein [Stenotrophomonas lactitubi]MBM9921988.1 hypothetical protein [Stenotrophomonas lactitubi]MBM9936553.1 hypothetical protein [Stenotrophomonas lactitubi]
MSVSRIESTAGKLLAIALLLATAIAAGLWAGNRWAEGGRAIKDRAEQQAYIGDLEQQLTRLHAQAADTAVAYAEAIDRMNTIANSLEHNREENRRFTEDQRVALATLLDRRPELRAARVGPDVLQHWNRSNQGKPAAAAPARDAGQPETGMPGAADGTQRPAGDPAGQSRPGDVPVSRLQRTGAGVDPGHRRLGGHGVAVVLPGSGAVPGSASGVR